MTFTVTKTTTRPVSGVTSFKDSTGLTPDVAASMANVSHAVRTNPAVQSRSVVISPDGLTKSITTVWNSQADYVSFQAANSADLAKIAGAASVYNKANGIAVSTTTAGA